MGKERVTARRRALLKGAAAASAYAVVGSPLLGCNGSSDGGTGSVEAGDGSRSGAGEWGGDWEAEGVANLWVDGERHFLQGGSDVYPHDPRVVAFERDRRFLDGAVEGVFTATGVGGGVVLRRSGPFQYYAAVYDAVTGLFSLIRKTGRRFGDASTSTEQTLQTLTDESERVLATIPALNLTGPVTIRLAADTSGGSGTALSAVLRNGQGLEFPLTAVDGTPELQQPGDAGVIATALTGLGLASNPGLPAVPSAGALFVTDQGAQIEDSPVGETRAELLVALSTAAYTAFSVETEEPAGVSAPSVVAATTGRPLAGGARLGIAADVPAEVSVEVADNEAFEDSRRIGVGVTGDLNGLFVELEGLPSGQRMFWRPVLRRRGAETVGPTRSFRVLPSPSEPLSPLTMVVGSCATEFNQTFRHIAGEQPDVFVWEGDLNYPDADGPLAQTVSGYTGMWQDFLWTPQLRPILDKACFAAQRDDHDYGRNDLRAEDIPTHGVVPWERLMNPETYYRFDAGPLGVWVLDQRRFADAASEPNTEDKSLLGMAQREWLLETLAESTAPFKIICSPMPFFFSVNNDTGWSGQFSAERALILAFLRDNVGGHIVAATGDAHSGAVVDRLELLEVRASPLDIPVAGWKAPSSGAGVVYSDVGKFYTVLRTGEADGAPFLDVELVRVGLGLGLDLLDEEIKTPVFQRRLHA